MILKKIKKKLHSHIKIHFFSIRDDSASHNYSPNHFTHLTLIIISNDFLKKNWVTRHRMIFSILKDTIEKTIYSVTLYTYTITEWENKKNKIIDVEKCIRKKNRQNIENIL